MYCVSDAMSRDPVTVTPDDSPEHARTLMRLGRIRHLPVVRDGVLLGLVAQRDVLYTRALRIADVMVKEPLTTTAAFPLRKAARLMFDRKIGCLPVIGPDQKLLGIITESDFVRFAADMASEMDRLEAMAAQAHR